MELSRRRTLPLLECSIAGLITIVLIILHLTVLMHAGPLWRDEISTLRLATMPTFSAAWSSLVYDPFPALYFLLLRGWSALGLGADDFDLRLFGYFMGLLLISAVWFTCWRINKSAPLWPLALFAFNPVTVQFGDSIRAYGIGLILILLAFALIWRLTFRDIGVGAFLTAAAAAVLSVQALFTNALLLFAICAGALAVCLRHKWWKRVGSILAVGIAAAASLAVYTPIFQETKRWSALCVAPSSCRDILLSYFHALGEGTVTISYVWVCLLIGGAFAALFFQFRSERWGFSGETRDELLFATVALIVATAGAVLFFRVVSWPTSQWYFLPLMAVSAICLHAILSALLRNNYGRIAGQIAVFLVVAISLSSARRHSLTRLTNADLTAEAIAHHAQKEDLILVSPYFYSISFQRYYHGAAPWTALPPIADYSLHRWDLLKEAMQEPEPIREILDRVQTTLENNHNVFLVGAFPYRGPGAPVPLAPAPQTASGWYLQDYLHNWAAQTSFLVYHHATRSRVFVIPEQERISGMERLWTLELSGWKPETIADAN